MGKLSVKDGTPVGNSHLCRDCSHGQFTTGYRESDVMVICGNTEPARLVPFVVHNCTDFWDRNRPGWEEMKSLALTFNESRKRPTPGFRGSGFGIVPVIAEGEDEDEFDEVARS